MNIYFFIRNESTHHWYDCTIEAWSENPNTYRDGIRESGFTLVEKLHIHSCKHATHDEPRKQFHCTRLDHELGTNLCTGHNASSVTAFIKDKTQNSYAPMDQITHRYFQKFKRLLLSIHSTYPAVNYTDLLFKQAPTCRILF